MLCLIVLVFTFLDITYFWIEVLLFMKDLRTSSVVCTLILCILHLSIGSNGDADTVGAPMEKSEQLALYSAIQGFVGKWWNGSDLYPDPCGWTPIQGVSCDLSDGFWYVTSLNIGPIHDNSLGCGSKVEFRSELFALKHLKSLSFFNCFVSPKNLVAIPTHNWEVLAESLELLEFRSNPGLIGQVPATFGNLSKLESLVLIQNGLKGEIPTDIGSLVNLKRLVMAENQFRGQIPYSFGRLSKLLILDMSWNSLSGPLPITFGGLTSLLKLDLSNNQLDGNIPKEIGNLKNLTLLDLSKNRFSGALTKSLQELSSLEELVLSDNPTGGEMMKLNWHFLKSLIVLDLSNMSLTGEIPESVAELKRLRFLGLNDNNLEGFISPKLAALPNISAIYLNGNNLTGELKFSEQFYRKMGRRFGAWNNTNLCYPMVLMSTSHVPLGVKPCQPEVTLYRVNLEEKSQLETANTSNNSPTVASLGVSRYASTNSIELMYYTFLVQPTMMFLWFRSITHLGVFLGEWVG